MEFKLGIARRRIAVLGYMGKWPERRAAQEKQAVLLRKRVGEIVAESRALRLAGDYDRALRSCKLALTLAPHDVDALIEMARATSVPHYRGLMSAGYAPLACLFRAVNNNDSLTAQQAGEIVTLLADQKGLVGRDELAVRLIRSAATILQTGSGAASGSRTAELHKLRKLAAHIEEESILWRQRHLVWHYLGLALEKRGETVEAEQMYAKAAALVRNHLRSLAALVRLARQRGDTQAADRYAARVAALTPAQPCAVTFAGKIRLLGYSVIPGESASGVAPMIRYYWELLEPIPEGCVLQTYLLDYEWRIVRPDQRRLVRASGVYPAEFARRGEVVVETRPLPPKFPNVRYLGFGARPAKVTAGSAEKWTGDAGSTLARLALISGDAK